MSGWRCINSFCMQSSRGIMTVSITGAMRHATAGPLSDLSSYDAMGLADLIRTRQLTPSELAEDTIRKIEAINPKLNAVVYKTYDRARKRASALLGDGPLAGVP